MTVTGKFEWQNYFVVSPEIGKCWHCGKDTRFVDMGFETYLHPGACDEAKTDEYFRALSLHCCIHPLSHEHFVRGIAARKCSDTGNKSPTDGGSDTGNRVHDESE